MKFTRSLPAKASASAKTPERMVMRRILILKRWMMNSNSEQASQQTSTASGRRSSIVATKALSASSDLRPLNTAK